MRKAVKENILTAKRIAASETIDIGPSICMASDGLPDSDDDVLQNTRRLAGDAGQAFQVGVQQQEPSAAHPEPHNA